MIFPVRRRHALRRAVSLSCQAVLVEPFCSVGTRLLDLSHHGGLLECDAALTAGDELVLCFEIGAQVVDVVAEVQNVSPDLRRAGLRFTEMGWDCRVALFVGLAGRPPRVPTRRPRMDYARSVRQFAAC